ncbi:MAG: hypothetical protein ACD_60C00090G0011 [uncultured bacterium]|nr:MAG: hypothetical protein ACD_60C00090G0011 [uncultured bacterium]
MDEILKNRLLRTRLPAQDQRKLVLLTGARQTGKTTLAKLAYPSLPYINLDAPENREKIRQVPTALWASSIGNALIDEAQKSPELFEKVKYAYDAHEISFAVMLGSSQITLLKNIRETLAGRIAIYEIYPLLMSEICTPVEKKISQPLLAEIVSGNDISRILTSVSPLLFDSEETLKVQANQHLLRWGGMPALLHIPEEERAKWLKDYEYTYLERDLADLARLNDLQPFRLFQKLAALCSGCLLNYSELARDSGVSVDTTRRYLEYLRLSYQVILLQPYSRNMTSSMVKTPKLYWLDVGILRQLSGFTGELTGEIYETMVVSEIYKWLRTMQHEAELFFYRTRHGLEMDLLIELPQGIIGIEIKARDKVTMRDVNTMRNISTQFSNWLGGIVIYNGNLIQKLAEPNFWAIPAWRLFT